MLSVEQSRAFQQSGLCVRSNFENEACLTQARQKPRDKIEVLLNPGMRTFDGEIEDPVIVRTRADSGRRFVVGSTVIDRRDLVDGVLQHVNSVAGA